MTWQQERFPTPMKFSDFAQGISHRIAGVGRHFFRPISDNLRTVTYNCTALKKIRLSKNLTELPFLYYGFFENCSSLTEVIIHSGVTKIEQKTFSECVSLKNIIFEGNVTEIAKYAFSGCSELENIALPDSVEFIDYGAFTDCTSLKTIDLGKSLKEIERYAFNNCVSLTDLVLPDSLETINRYAFYDCNNLKKLSFGKNLHYIDEYVWSLCPNLEAINIDSENPYNTSVDGVVFDKEMTKLICYPAGKKDIPYIVPDTVNIISSGAFQDAVNLKLIKLPDGLQIINGKSFIGCTALSNINIPESVDIIEYEAFLGCENLKELTIPKSVSKIKSHIFGFDMDKNPYNNVRINCYAGSEAQKYAREYEVEFLTPGMKGDVNIDGKTDIADAVILKKYLVNQKITTDIDTDVNGDGKTNCFDMILIKRMLLQ